MEGYVAKEIKDLMRILAEGNNFLTMVQSLSMHIKPCAELMHIGKMDVTLLVPASNYVPKGENNSYVVYESLKGYETEGSAFFEHMTDDGGNMMVTFWPATETAFDSEEKDELKFFSELLFIILSRNRFRSIVEWSGMTDRLTGCLNANGVGQQVGKLCAMGSIKRYTAIMVNFKNFKYINYIADAKGGDAYLKDFVHAIQLLIEPDEIIGRLGGDYFIIITQNSNTGKILTAIEQLEIMLDIAGEEKPFKLTARIGIYAIREGDTFLEVMNNTSLALAEAKKLAHEETVRFSPSMLKKSMEEKEIAQSFHKAILTQEFEVAYQPQIDMKTGRTIRLEALARWKRGDKVLMPDEFAPALEQDASICQLDFYVLEQVCRQIQGWKREGISTIPVTINFSNMHLSNRNIVYDILDVLDRFGVEPHLIGIEFAERYGGQLNQSARMFMEMLRDAGIQLIIDNFGKDSTTLSTISNVTVDCIKLDRILLDNLKKGQEKNQKLLANIIKMLHDLDARVLAEGVETLEEAELLKDLGCDEAQGYFYSLPVNSEEVTKMIRNRVR